jgi:hypothetical protein
MLVAVTLLAGASGFAPASAQTVNWTADPTEGAAADIIQMAQNDGRTMAAHAPVNSKSLTVYDCDVIIGDTADERRLDEKRTFLVEGYSGNVSVQDAWIELGINKNAGLIEGRLLGKEGFSGPLPVAKFQSSVKGPVVIACNEPLPVSYILKNQADDIGLNSSGHMDTEFFTLESRLNRGHPYNSIRAQDLDDNSPCYLGDPQEALKAISRELPKQSVDFPGVPVDAKILGDGKTIEFSYPEKQGTHCHDYWGGPICDSSIDVTTVRQVGVCPAL